MTTMKELRSLSDDAVVEFLGSVEMFELIDGRYSKAVGVTSGTIHDIPGCPGLGIDVDAVNAALVLEVRPDALSRVGRVRLDRELVHDLGKLRQFEVGRHFIGNE